jgi:TolB protein
MKEKLKVKSVKLKVFIFACSLFIVYCSLLTDSYAKVYIDITSPAFRKLPVSISYRGHETAKEAATIIKDDLDFTGIFYVIDPDILGAEINIKIDVESAEKIKADVYVFDLIENTEILSKRYTSSEEFLRTLAHTISNDIYYEITGQNGIFKTKLSYIVSTSDKKWLYIMDWDGFNPKRVVTNGLTLNHTWSQNGLNIFYASARNKRWGIYMRDLNSFREQPVFSSQGLNLVGGVNNNRMVFSSSKDGNPDIYVMNADGTDVRLLTKSSGIDVSPSFSPDGSMIVLVSDRSGTPQIYTMNSDGTNLRRLTFEGSYNTSPAWSPDGTWVAFVGRKNGKNQIFMIKSDGSDMTQLTYAGNNENPSLSPDGRYIVFDSDRTGRKGIYLMNILGEGQRMITPRNVKAMNPKWSPNFK